MFAPIFAAIWLNAPVECNNPHCNNPISNPHTAVFIVRNLSCVAYCNSRCYLDAWRDQLDDDDFYRKREEILDALGYYIQREEIDS